MSKDSEDKGSAPVVRAFDVRTFIAMLIGLYGVVLVVTGLVATSAEDLDKAGGVNINLWAGIGMVALAAVFQAWAMLRPIVVPVDLETDS